MMGSPVGEHPSRIVPEPPERVDEAVAVEGGLGRRTQPEIPVQTRRRFRVPGPSHPGRTLVADIPGVDPAHLADGAVLDQLDGFLEVLA